MPSGQTSVLLMLLLETFTLGHSIVKHHTLCSSLPATKPGR